MKKFPTTLALLLLPLLLLGREEYSLFNLQSGLPSNRINDMVEGPDSLIYLATDMGISRFDGQHFVNFSKDLGLELFPGRRVDNLVIHSDTLYALSYKEGCVWISLKDYQKGSITQRGVSDIFFADDGQVYIYYNKGDLELRRDKKVVASRNFNSERGTILFAKRGNLYITDNQGIKAIDAFELNTKKKVKHDGLGYYKHELIDVRDSVFAFRSIENTQVYNYSLEVERSDNYTDLNNFNKYRKINSSACRFTAIGIKNFREVFFFTKNRRSLVKSLSAERNFEYRSVLEVSGSYFLIGTNRGLILLDISKGLQENRRNIYYQKKESIRVRRKPIQGGNGGLYFLGYPSLVHSKSGGEVSVHNKENVYTYDGIFSKNKLVCTTEGKGLGCFDTVNEKWEFIYSKSDSKRPHFYAIDKGNGGRIYTGGTKGIFYYDTVVNILRRCVIDKGSLGVIYDIKYNPQSDEFIVASDSGVKRVRKSTVSDLKFEVVKAYKHKKNQGTVRPKCLEYCPDKMRLFVGTEDGIFCHKYPSMKLERHIKGVDYGGDCRVLAIEQGYKGRIWFSTMDGIGVLDPSNWKLSFWNRGRDLINNEFNYKASLLIQDSLWVIGGLDGYDFINTADFGRCDGKGQVYLSAILKRGEKGHEWNVNPDTLKKLSFILGKEELKIFLRGEELFGKGNYEYKIGGSTWKVAKGGVIDGLFDLAEGRHPVQVRYVGPRGCGDNNIRDFIIEAKRPFFQSKAFYMGGGILLLSLGVISFGLFYRLVHEERRLRSQVAMDLHDELGTFLTRALHLANRDNENSSLFKNTLKSAVYSLRLYMNSIDLKRTNIRDFMDEIKGFLVEQFHYSDIQAYFSIAQQDGLTIDAQLRRDLMMVFYEASTNTLKYGTGNRFFVEMDIEYTGLEIWIWDDGRVLPDFDKKERWRGLKNIEKRVLRNGGQVVISKNLQGSMYIHIRIKNRSKFPPSFIEKL